MAWSQTDLDALETAIKSGVQSVKYSDKEVTYRSVEDMLKVRDLIRKSLGQTNSTERFFANFDKGLDRR